MNAQRVSVARCQRIGEHAYGHGLTLTHAIICTKGGELGFAPSGSTRSEARRVLHRCRRLSCILSARRGISWICISPHALIITMHGQADDLRTHCMQKRLGQAGVVDGVAAVMRAFLDASLDVQIYGCVNMYTHARRTLARTRTCPNTRNQVHTAVAYACMQMCGV